MSDVSTRVEALDAAAYDDQWSRLVDFLRFNPGARHRRRLVLRALRTYAPDVTTVLDVGCGVGEMVAFLAPRFTGTRFAGVDLSTVGIDSCRRRFPEHEWSFADVTRDQLPTRFGAVVCSELLEHLDDPGVALDGIADSVVAGGIVVVTVPNGPVFATERAVGHVEHPTPDQLRAWFDHAGLELLELRRWGWPGYRLLKRAANIDPERAMAAFGSGRYSWPKRRANDLAYVLVGLLSRSDHRQGPQTVAVGRRVPVGD